LGGYNPFDTTERDAPPLRTQILAGRVIFHEQEWKDVSDAAKDFIKKLLQPDEKSRMTAEQALMHPFLEFPDPTPNKSSPKRGRKASIRQINFVTPQRKSVLLSNSPQSKATKGLNPTSQSDGNLDIDNLMESLGTSPPHSPTMSPKQSPRSKTPSRSDDTAPQMPLSHTLKNRRTSRINNPSLPRDKFHVGMEELKMVLKNVKTDCEKVEMELSVLAKELQEMCEEGLKYNNL